MGRVIRNAIRTKSEHDGIDRRWRRDEPTQPPDRTDPRRVAGRSCRGRYGRPRRCHRSRGRAPGERSGGTSPCIDAIQDPENAASGGWTLDTWNEFISGVEDGGDVIDGCAGDFGVGKLVINVINVLDKATGDPVDDTVDITKLLNAFQFGYEDIVAPSDTSRLEPYCDLRWTEVSQADNDEETARQNVSNFVDVGDFRFDETGFGGRPLRFLHWVGGVDDPVIPISTTNSRSTRSCSAGRATRTTTRSRHRRSLTSAAATSSSPDATPD